MIEQETEEAGLIRYALSSLFVTGFGRRPSTDGSPDTEGRRSKSVTKADPTLSIWRTLDAEFVSELGQPV
jgi:hypothetical protein